LLQLFAVIRIGCTFDPTKQSDDKKMTIASQILQQLGGNKFIVMTGATCYSDGNTLVAKFKGSKIANIMYVTLNAMDTYDVKFCKFRGLDVKTIKEVSGVYSDMLKPLFESTTFLRTSL
jgi:hypothetical protein